MEATHKYKIIHDKLDKCICQQIKSPGNIIELYPRVVKNMHFSFTPEELSLLNKGLKYNLHF